MLHGPHVAPFSFFYFLIRVQTTRTWTGCSPACVQPLKPITADGSCGADWRDRGGTEAGGRSVAQLATEDAQPLSALSEQRDERSLQITKDKRQRFYWTPCCLFLFILLYFIVCVICLSFI